MLDAYMALIEAFDNTPPPEVRLLDVIVAKAAQNKDVTALNALKKKYNWETALQLAAFELGRLDDRKSLEFLIKFDGGDNIYPYLKEFTRGNCEHNLRLKESEIIEHKLDKGLNFDKFDNAKRVRGRASVIDLVISYIIGAAMNKDEVAFKFYRIFYDGLYQHDDEGLNAAMHLGMLNSLEGCQFMIQHSKDPHDMRIHCAAGAIYGANPNLAIKLLEEIKSEEAKPTAIILYRFNEQLRTSVGLLPAFAGRSTQSSSTSAQGLAALENPTSAAEATTNSPIFNEPLSARLARMAKK